MALVQVLHQQAVTAQNHGGVDQQRQLRAVPARAGPGEKKGKARQNARAQRGAIRQAGAGAQYDVIGPCQNARRDPGCHPDKTGGNRNAENLHVPRRAVLKAVIRYQGIGGRGSRQAGPQGQLPLARPGCRAQQEAGHFLKRARSGQRQQQVDSAVHFKRKAAKGAARPNACDSQGRPDPGRSRAGKQDSAARQRQQDSEGGIGIKVAAGSALPLQQRKRRQVAGGRAHQHDRGHHRGHLQTAAEADGESHGALSGFKAGEREAAKQRPDDGAGKVNGEQGHLRGEQPGKRNGRVTLGQAAFIGDQPGGQQNRQIGGDGAQPALAQPVLEAGGSFDGGGHGEEQEREGQDVVSGQQERGGGSQDRQGGEGGDDQQVFAPGNRHAESREGQQNGRGGPGANHVETHGRLPEQGTEHQDGGETVNGRFEPVHGRAAGGPAEPQQSIEDSGDNSDFGGQGAGFGEGAEQVCAGQPQQGPSHNGQVAGRRSPVLANS